MKGHDKYSAKTPEQYTVKFWLMDPTTKFFEQRQQTVYAKRNQHSLVSWLIQNEFKIVPDAIISVEMA